MYTEDDFLPISGLQHLHFCERQWGLIHIEQVWEENRLTAEGRVLHERAHSPGSESRPGLRIVRGLRLHSFQLGLTGQADIVEFRNNIPFPIEYKRGKPKNDSCDEVQLCAQAICLEEMFQTTIEAGAIFYGQPRRRTEVRFTISLRAQTAALAKRMHALQQSGLTPHPVYSKKCENCSLKGICLPRLLEKPQSVAKYLSLALASHDQSI